MKWRLLVNVLEYIVGSTCSHIALQSTLILDSVVTRILVQLWMTNQNEFEIVCKSLLYCSLTLIAYVVVSELFNDKAHSWSHNSITMFRTTNNHILVLWKLMHQIWLDKHHYHHSRGNWNKYYLQSQKKMFGHKQCTIASSWG